MQASLFFTYTFVDNFRESKYRLHTRFLDTIKSGKPWKKVNVSLKASLPFVMDYYAMFILHDICIIVFFQHVDISAYRKLVFPGQLVGKGTGAYG